MSKHGLDTIEHARFSRGWWFQKARSVFWIVLVTVLIWVYADMEFTDKDEFHAKVVFSAGRANQLVILSSRTVEITFELQGSRGSLDRYRRLLTERSSLIHCRLPDSYGPGEHVLRTVEDILNRDDELLRAGLSVLSASPNQVRVELDRIEENELKVEFDHTGANFAEDPTLKPAKVVVRAARSKWREIRSRLGLPPNTLPMLKTQRADLKGEPTGTVIRKQYDLVRSIAGVGVEPKQASVEVTFKIEQVTDTRTFTVTVQVLAPVGTWKEYELRRKDELEWRKQIVISGPKDQLTKLRPEDIEAYVEVTEDDKRPTETFPSRKVTVRLPEEMQLRLVGDQPTVSFKLVKRTAGPGT